MESSFHISGTSGIDRRMALGDTPLRVMALLAGLLHGWDRWERRVRGPRQFRCYFFTHCRIFRPCRPRAPVY